MAGIYDRCILLLGEAKFALLQEKRVLVLGLGGVGGTAAIALARSGITHLTLVDFDNVDPSNLNRQLLFEDADIGEEKVLAAKKRLLAVNPSLDIEALSLDLAKDELPDVSRFDYVIDAIDDLPAKIRVLQLCAKKDVNVIVSLGMANRLDPTKVEITKLDKTYNDPLAKKFRHMCKEANLNTRHIDVCFSSETPLFRGPKPASMMMVPSAAGLALASFVIASFLPKE